MAKHVPPLPRGNLNRVQRAPPTCHPPASTPQSLQHTPAGHPEKQGDKPLDSADFVFAPTRVHAPELAARSSWPQLNEMNEPFQQQGRSPTRVHVPELAVDHVKVLVGEVAQHLWRVSEIRIIFRPA